MQLVILDKSTELLQDATLYTQIESKIQQEAIESKLHFSHLSIDGVDVHEDYEQYITNHAESINEIKVTMITIQQLNQEILESAYEYISGATPKIHSLTEEFYKNPVMETWNKLEGFLEAIDWLNHIIENIQEPKEESLRNSLLNFKNHMFEQLESLHQAMVNKDTVLIGDILKYEITVLFTDLSRAIIKIQ